MDQVTKVETERKAASVRRVFDIYDWVGTAIISLVLIVAIFTFAFRIVGVDGTSMCDTLQDQDRLVLTSSYYYTPARGDIVVINRYTQEPLIKRIIAVEGDKLEITAAGRVIVNDKELTENYIRGGKDSATIQKSFTTAQVVPKGCVFVMGDNRDNSHDSRDADIAFIKTENIVGHAVFRLFPFDKIGKL